MAQDQAPLMQLSAAQTQELLNNIKGSITLFGVLKISWDIDISIPQVVITVSIVTPFGTKTIGSITLNPQHPTLTIGGSFLGFTVKATFTLDTKQKVVTYDLTFSGPGIGNHQKSGILFHY
jgi:hypothetical protein